MTLEALRAANPHLKLYDVTDAAFAPYGRILTDVDCAGIDAALRDTPIPDAGNVYVADDPMLHQVPEMKVIEEGAFGGMPVETGYCNGRGFQLNALEYHKCSEINYSTTGCVLLMALPDDVHDRRVRSADVVGFYLPAGTLIEVHPRVLHFAPCRIDEGGFNCLVVLEMGTNAPIDCVNTAAPGERGLLWMKNKWLIAHAESVPASKGAFVGIDGENLALKL